MLQNRVAITRFLSMSASNSYDFRFFFSYITCNNSTTIKNESIELVYSYIRDLYELDPIIIDQLLIFHC